MRGMGVWVGCLLFLCSLGSCESTGEGLYGLNQSAEAQWTPDGGVVVYDEPATPPVYDAGTGYEPPPPPPEDAGVPPDDSFGICAPSEACTDSIMWGGRWLMPKFGCAHIDANRRVMREAIDEVIRLDPNIGLGGKPLGDILQILLAIGEKTEEIKFAIEMITRVLALNALCIGR